MRMYWNYQIALTCLKCWLKRLERCVIQVNLDGITPCFMAKPYGNQPGCSGHLHFSLQDENGNNLFADSNDPQKISNTCRQFIAGVLQGLESIMAILAPTINR